MEKRDYETIKLFTRRHPTLATDCSYLKANMSTLANQISLRGIDFENYEVNTSQD